MKANEQIEAYFREELSPSERQAFEVQLAQDENLRAQVEEYRQLFEALAEKEVLDFRQTLASLKKEAVVKPMRPKASAWFRYAVAAGIAFLLLLAGLYWLNRPSNEQQLYAQYFEPYPLGQIERGNDAPAANDWTSAYQQGDFETALSQLVVLQDQYPDSIRLQVFHANALLGANQTEAAIAQLRQLGSDQFLYQEEIVWYLALAYLKAGDRIPALALLQAIATTEGPTYNKARAAELLEALK